MAIVEDEVRNESGEENEIEVVVEEDDGEEQDSADEDSDDDGSDDEEMLETKVAMLEQRVTENPYNYDDHIELIQALWRSSELDRWREAFTRLQKMSLVSSEHWVMRLQTESSLAHSQADVEKIADLFQQALMDCFTLSVLTEWCTWALHLSDIEFSRKQLEEIVKRAGADPLSGKIFWDAKKEFETTQLETMSEDEPGYKEQEARILYCVEEVVSRPLLHHDESWAEFEEWATKVKDKEYIEKVKLQHEAAADFLEKITRFEDKLLTLVDPEEKCDEFQEYISTVKQLAEDTEKYGECDINGILKVLYERATTDCLTTERCYDLCVEFIEHVREHSSRATYQRAVEACTRRQPHVHKFWMWAMRQAEKDGKEFDEIKSILETALSRGMKSFKEADFLWMSYLESVRRHTDFEDPSSVDRLRRTFRLAWDSLAEAWGAAADESFVPIYWARVEYTRVRDHVRGREVFEEAIKYGNNRTICKYWEMLIHLEMARQPPPPVNKMRDLYKRALLSVQDYLPTICTLWTFWERDVGTLDSTIECYELCEKKLKEWQEKMEAQKKNYQRNKGKQNMPKKKSKFDKKQKNQGETTQSAMVNKGKRKLTSAEQPIDYKKRKEADNEMDTDSGDDNKSNKLKRTRTDSEDNDDATDKKRKRREESLDSDTGPTPTGRDACTLFVSNLDFHVNEKHLREKLSEYGEIVSLRIKTGIKSFGGSICYCQYKNADSVEEALKHDRSPLDGRPMFLSRYNAKKTKQGFKYSTEPEKNKLFVKNLPFSSCTKEKLTKIFEQYGKLKDIRVVTYKDGKPKGLAYVDYEDEESAATALEKTNGLLLEDRKIEVAYSAPPPRAAPGPAPTLGQPKRETGGMRRTQISSLIPRVLQTPAGPGTSTSTPSANGSANGQKQLSNSDFRDMLLKK